MVVQREERESGLHEITAQNVHKICTKYDSGLRLIETVAAAVVAAGDVREMRCCMLLYSTI